MNLKFESCYDVHEILGQGSFGTVKRCVKRKTGKSFAVKIIAKTMSDKDFQHVLREAKMCRRLQHPNVVGLLETYNQWNALYLVFDLVVGGELMDDIERRRFYSEADGSFCMQQILEAINYCHYMGIAHCDLNPENILLASKERGAAIKIADFGLAGEFRGDERPFRGIIGTYAYMAPEIVSKKFFGKSVDMWACGVILFLLIVGELPFPARKEKVLFAQILSGIYKYPSDKHVTISADAKDIIKRMLTTSPSQRITAAEALKHRWISQRKSVAPRKHLGETIVRLKKFNARRKFKGAVFAAIAVQKINNIIPRRKGKVLKRNDGNELVRTRNEMTPSNQEDLKEEIIELTETLASAWNDGDRRTVESLCDPHLTTFDPEYGVVSGIHNIAPLVHTNGMNTMVLEPHVHLLGHGTACIAYIRSTEYIRRNRGARGGGIVIEEAEETRVWQKRRGIWRNVHFHCGLSYDFEE